MVNIVVLQCWERGDPDTLRHAPAVKPEQAKETADGLDNGINERLHLVAECCGE